MPATPPQPQTTFTALDYDKEIECPICMDPWTDPIEIDPCRHVFCRACIGRIAKCPECRADIKKLDEPNRIIKNMADNVIMQCDKCRWKGTREATRTHDCAHPQAPTPSNRRNSLDSSSTPSPMSASVNSTSPTVIPQGRPIAMPPRPAGYPPVSGYMPGTSGYLPQQAGTQQYPPFQGSPAAYGAPPNGYPQPGPYFPAYGPPPSGSGYYQAQPYGQPQYAQPPQMAPQKRPPPPPTPQTRRIPTIHATGNAPWNLYGLSQEEYDQIVTIFMTFDEDDSGELDKDELTKLVKWLNYAQQPGDIDRIFAEMDGDNSGALSLDEFCTWLKYNKPNPQSLYGLTPMEYNSVMMQFHVYDTNGDGELSCDEFVKLCNAMRFYKTPQEARAVFQQVDVDHSGAVDLNEFLLFRAKAPRR